MTNTFERNQKGGVSPKFAVLVSGVCIAIGGMFFFQSEATYSILDNISAEIEFVTNL